MCPVAGTMVLRQPIVLYNLIRKTIPNRAAGRAIGITHPFTSSAPTGQAGMGTGQLDLFAITMPLYTYQADLLMVVG